MRVLPVLDILDGEVVHGIAGRRAEYRPLKSLLTDSSDPQRVARVMRDAFGFDCLYVADLDGILKQQPNFWLYRQLVAEGFDLMVDAGVRTVTEAASIQNTGVGRLIVGLESCRSPIELATIAGLPIELTFSLDLLRGSPIKAPDGNCWSDDPFEIVRQAVRANAGAILPLDLADVGMGTGGSTDRICAFIHDEFPQVGLIAGGGVRGTEDLTRMRALGVDAVLVASALHDGRLTTETIRALA
jgi:phosphoribosylformimino-5-aminoimidazole carboxamide ribotide isomerase